MEIISGKWWFLQKKAGSASCSRTASQATHKPGAWGEPCAPRSSSGLATLCSISLLPSSQTSASQPSSHLALTGSALQCGHPHSPPATCPPRPTGAGRLSWSQACLGTQTSAGTGNASPTGGPPAARGMHSQTGNCEYQGHHRSPQTPPPSSHITYPRDILHPENTCHQVLICCARHKLHLHEAILVPAWLWPVLWAWLDANKGVELRSARLVKPHPNLHICPGALLHPGSPK